MNDKLSYSEFRRVCEAAGVEGDEAEMSHDYATGQVVGDLIDRLCVMAEEERPEETEEGILAFVDNIQGPMTYDLAMDVAALFTRWAAENSTEEIDVEGEAEEGEDVE